MNAQLNKELKNAQSVKDIIDTMNKYYLLDEPLSLMNKGVIMAGLSKVIKVTNIKPRK